MLCVLNLAFFMKSNILCKLFLFVKDLNDTDIGSLHNLEEIRLHNNKLTHLPPGKSKARQCYNRSRRWTLFLILDFFSKEYSYYLHLQELSVCCKLVTTKTMFISIISSIFYDALNNEWFQTLWFISILFFYIGIWDSLTRLETININCNPISSIPTRMFKKNPNFRRFVWSNMGSKCIKGIRT